MRIRTLKPEFWQHEAMASLPDFTRLLAIALLNWADDEGYFPASVHLVRGSVMPFEDDSAKILRALDELSQCGWIDLGKGPDGRQVGRVVNFSRHQKIDRPNRSKIKELATFGEDSPSTQRDGDEPSLLEGNREQGKEEEGKAPSIPQGGSPKQDILSLSLPEQAPQTDSPASNPPPLAKKKKGGAAAEPEFPADFPTALHPAMREWLAYKRERGCSYKPLGMVKLLRSVAALSTAELQAAVDLAMSRNWQGLVLDRVEVGARKTPDFAKKEEGAPMPAAEVEPIGWRDVWPRLYSFPPPRRWREMPDANKTDVLAELKKGGGAHE